MDLYLACTDMKCNSLALGFHGSQLVGNKLLHLSHGHICCCSLRSHPMMSQVCLHNFFIIYVNWNLSCCQLLCCDPKHREDGGKVLVPDLVKHLVFARQLELGWGFRFCYVRRELNGATRYSKCLVQEAFIGERRKKTWRPARKGQPRLRGYNLPV